MEREGYWNLFWRTGLPEAWLLSRWKEKTGAVAAFGMEESGESPV